MSRERYEDFRIGDRVYCLAWVGIPFEVVARNDERKVISIQSSAAAARYGAQVDIFPDTLFMLTHEPWDQIWFWPDRVGERYEQVFDRFVRSHNEGDIVNGYFFEGGLAGLVVDRSDRRAMAFRIRALDEGARQIRVHPVVALDNGATLLTCYEPSIAPERWLKAGPTVPLRLEMRMYRWCLSYGEIVMNWQDFLEASNASS